MQFNATNSLYNVNEYNSRLSLTVNGTTYINTFPYGNYNSSTLATAFASLFSASGFSITFNRLTNAFTIVHTTYTFTLNSGSSIGQVMGFSNSTSYASTLKSLVLPFCCNFNGFQNLNIHLTNLATQNFDSYNACFSTIVQSVPIIPNCTTINFMKQFEYQFPIYTNNIDYIEIALLDDRENELNFMNGQWNMTLCFSSVINIQRFPYMKTFHSVLGKGYETGYLKGGEEPEATEISDSSL